MYADTIGIVCGGTYVALVDSSGIVSPLSLSGSPMIGSVAISPSSLSVIGGSLLNRNYGAIVSPNRTITEFSNNLQYPAYVYANVAVNAFGDAIAVGNGGGGPLAVVANAEGEATFLTGFPPMEPVLTFNSAAINNAGVAIIGGSPAGNGLYAAFVYPQATTVTPILDSPGFGQAIRSVSINQSGNSIVGGIYMNNTQAYASLFDPAGAPVATVVFPFVGGDIKSVSIANSGTSIIGGFDNANAAYAALVDPAGGLHALSGDPLPAMGTINSVSIKDLCGNFSNDYAIIGGQDATGAAYAAFVDGDGVVHNIGGLPVGPGAAINSVSLNQYGAALIGGTPDGTNPYAALITPFGQLIPLDVSGGSPITSVSIRLALAGQGLTGNNLRFAKYINRYAPEKAFYFCPAFFDGTLSEALESAAPTRNAISVFTADNNLFFLNHGLSAHLRNHRHVRKKPVLPNVDLAAFEKHVSEELFLVQNNSPQQDAPADSSVHFNMQGSKQRPYSIWFEALGAFASQQSQNQTVGFDPSTGGFVFAFEGLGCQTVQLGGGAAYTFTHIHEHNDAGTARINQEYLFAYATWSDEKFYVDTAIWTGIFQTHQVRHIRMTGFDFDSTSDPRGFQLSPHFECGYDKEKYMDSKAELVIDPFVMVDWINTWQDHYEEKGDGPFNVDQKAQYSSFLRTEAGFRFYEMISFNSWRLILEEKGSYVYKKPFKVGTINAFFVGSPGSFTMETFSSAQNLGVAEMSLIFQPMKQQYPYSSVSYQGEFGRGYQSHQVLFETSWDF